MRGRKKESKAMAKLKGTYQPSRHQENDIEIEKLLALPKPPTMFRATAKNIYKISGEILLHYELLNQANLSLFVAYCQEMAVYLDNHKAIKKEGILLEETKDVYDVSEGYDENGKRFKTKTYRETVTVKYYKNPRIGIAKDAIQNATRIAGEFGMTPASLSRIKLPTKEQTDEFDDFLNS